MFLHSALNLKSWDFCGLSIRILKNKFTGYPDIEIRSGKTIKLRALDKINKYITNKKKKTRVIIISITMTLCHQVGYKTTHLSACFHSNMLQVCPGKHKMATKKAKSFFRFLGYSRRLPLH